MFFHSFIHFIHKFIIKRHFLQCLFVRESNKKQKRGRIISKFTKGETFSSLMTTKFSWGHSYNVASLLAPSWTLQIGQEENVPGHSIESTAY